MSNLHTNFIKDIWAWEGYTSWWPMGVTIPSVMPAGGDSLYQAHRRVATGILPVVSPVDSFLVLAFGPLSYTLACHDCSCIRKGDHFVVNVAKSDKYKGKSREKQQC